MTVYQASPEPTLIDLARDVWRLRAGVFLGGVLGCLAALLFLALAVPQTRVTMLIGPTDNTARADVKALLPDNPSFALQYLVDTVGSRENTDFSRFEQTLRGPAVAGRVLDDALFTDGFRRTGLFRFSASEPVRSAEDLSARMMKKIRIEPVGNTAMRRVILDHPDGAAGIRILQRLYVEADHMIRIDMAERARGRAQYLKDSLQSVQHPDHRRALASLLMEQEHILMILAIDEPFAAVVAEAPYAGIKPVWPQAGIFLTGFALAGMMAGYVLQGLVRKRPQG